MNLVCIIFYFTLGLAKTPVARVARKQNKTCKKQQTNDAAVRGFI